jgi:hypothetical protein
LSLTAGSCQSGRACLGRYITRRLPSQFLPGEFRRLPGDGLPEVVEELETGAAALGVDRVDQVGEWAGILMVTVAVAETSLQG